MVTAGPSHVGCTIPRMSHDERDESRVPAPTVRMRPAVDAAVSEPRQSAGLLELDHVILFGRGVDDTPLEVAGFTLETGRRHVGQGTRNRRICFGPNYVEILWIEDLAEVAARGLDFEARCAGAPGACRVGVVLRGRLPDDVRDRLTRYELPDAPGVVLHLVPGTVAAPFVAVFETDDVAAMHPARRIDASFLAHPCGATGIERVAISAAARPALDDVALTDVAFAVGTPAVELDLGAGVVARW
jgi:hypothetical protein